MNQLFIGQNSSGKTTNIKKYIQELNEKVIILDFNDDYDDVADEYIYVDDINPLLSELTLNDVKALNAGYLADSHCLWKKAEELLREYKGEYPEFKDLSFDEIVDNYSKDNLVEETIERLHISWNNVENSYGKILNQKIPLKKYKKHISLEDTIEDIFSRDVVVLKSKNIHSDHLRAITFILLSRISHLTNEHIFVVGDDLSSLFNNGNSKLFSKTLKFNYMHFILSFNKSSNVPTNFISDFDKYYIHKFENNSEVKILKKQFPIKKNLKTLSIGDYIQVEVPK